MRDFIRVPLVRINDAVGRALGSKFKKVPYSRPATLRAKSLFQDRPVRVIEIGCAAGNNALDIFKQLNVSEFVVVDPYESYVGFDDYDKRLLVEMRKAAEKRLEPFKRRVRWIHEDSATAVSKIDGEVDFIYVDGNHKYEYVLSDMENYYRLLSRRFVFGGHDIDAPDVARAFVEFAAQISAANYEIKDPDWIIYKD